MARKIHISLVGKQTMPIFLGINETSPDITILIHSTSTHKEALHIANNFGGKVDFVNLDPVNYASITKQIAELLQQYQEDEVSINLSGGTKPWTLAFALCTQNMHNVTLLYVDQNCTFCDFTHIKQWECEQEFSMQKLMIFNGQIPNSYKKLSEYDEDDFYVANEIEKLRSFSINEFNNITILDLKKADELKEKEKGTFCTKYGSYVDWDKEEKEVTIYLSGKNSPKKVTLESPNIISLLFNSGWFELQVAQLISEWEYAQEVWMNAVYPDIKKQPKNEIDIIVNTGKKLLMIECKTQIKQITDIDKFNTAVKNYGGMGSKALFLTKEPMKESAKEKCNDNRILYFSLGEHKSSKEAKQKLFQYLNRELFNINTK